ncbi:MAG: hypothetical protein U0670_14280 [Anaerolineae bacterium]
MSNKPQTQPLSTIPAAIEEPYPGLMCEWFHNPQIVIYRLTSISPSIVTYWQALVLQTLENWDKSNPYLAMHDVSSPGVSLQYATLVRFDLLNIGITDSGREQAESFFNLHPGFQARIAIGFNLSVSGQVSQTVMDRLKLKHPAITYKTFFNRERSLSWLFDAVLPKSAPKTTEETQEINAQNGNGVDNAAV